MERLRVLVLSGVLLICTVGFTPAAGAAGVESARPAAVRVLGGHDVPAADSLSPPLSAGSMSRPLADLPNDNDGDAADYDQVWLVVISFLFLAALVGSSLGFYLWRRSRKSRALLRERRAREN